MRVSKSASQLTGRNEKERDQQGESQSERRKERRQGYCVLGFDFPINAEEEEMQYSAVNF